MKIWQLLIHSPKYLVAYLALFTAIKPQVQATNVSECPVLPGWGNLAISPTPLFTQDYTDVLNQFDAVTNGYAQDYQKLEDNFIDLYENSTPWEQTIFKRVLFSDDFKIEINKKQNISFRYGKTGENANAPLTYNIHSHTLNVNPSAWRRKDLPSHLRHEFLHEFARGQLPQDPEIMHELETLLASLIRALNDYHQGIYNANVRQIIQLFERLSPNRYEQIRHNYDTNGRVLKQGELILYKLVPTIAFYNYEYPGDNYAYRRYEERVATLFGYLEPDILADLVPKTFQMLNEMLNVKPALLTPSFRNSGRFQ